MQIIAASGTLILLVTPCFRGLEPDGRKLHSSAQEAAQIFPSSPQIQPLSRYRNTLQPKWYGDLTISGMELVGKAMSAVSCDPGAHHFITARSAFMPTPAYLSLEGTKQ
ncbi:hypothetical protein ACYCAX_18955, partial [Pseudomonas sp. MT3]